MESADYWRLCDHVSLFQAIMLILGFDPSDQLSWDMEGRKNITLPRGYAALKTAISNAVLSGQIEAKSQSLLDEYNGDDLPNTVDIDKTIISVNH